MMPAEDPVVVLGVGNVLLRDDGAGILVVEGLRRLAADDPGAVPVGTRLVDGGTLGLGLLGSVQGAGSLLLVDAVDLGLEAGSIRVLRDGAIAAAGAPGAGAAAGGLAELLAVARLMGWLPDPVTLVGVQVADTGLGVGLSPLVEAALPDVVETARTEIRALHERARAGASTRPTVRHQEEATA